jgi:tetratricopeptide (TPR) repeat protein
VRPNTPDDAQLDLTPEQQRRIDDLFAQLDDLDDHALLGVVPGSDRAAIRRAYFERVAEFHPDRFFRKRLGAYKTKMEAISARASRAFETLAARGRTTESPLGEPQATSPPAPASPDPAREKALAALKQQLQLRHAEAKRLAAEAARAASHGDVAGAADAYRRAAALAPNDPTIQAASAEAKRAADALGADTHARQAEFEERFGHWAEAARSWQRVLDSNPGDARARERLAAALARAAGSGAGGVR